MWTNLFMGLPNTDKELNFTEVSFSATAVDVHSRILSHVNSWACEHFVRFEGGATLALVACT